ncbi:MAG: hypothetical protein ACE5GF_06800, partial [Thermodesulfobacteriota bacterium]
MKQGKKHIVCVALIVLFTAAFFALSYRAAQAATTGTPWASAKSDYPASTDGTVSALTGGIKWSRHNLSSLSNWFQPYVDNPPSINKEIMTTQVCVFCHTPHHANAGGGGPLWNRSNTATTYVAYGATMAGTDISTVGGASLACLSCHDGITTFDTIINAPGKGSQTDGIGVDRTFYWGMWGDGFSTDQGNDHFRSDAGTCDRCHPQEESDRLNIGKGPSFSVTYDAYGRPNGGTADLSNDHPINVIYPAGGSASLRDTSTVISSIDMGQPNSGSYG